MSTKTKVEGIIFASALVFFCLFAFDRNPQFGRLEWETCSGRKLYSAGNSNRVARVIATHPAHPFGSELLPAIQIRYTGERQLIWIPWSVARERFLQRNDGEAY